MAFWRDVFRAATAKMSGESFVDYAKEEAERKRNRKLGQLGMTTVSLVDLKRMLIQKEAAYNRVVDAERARGNVNYPYVELTDGMLGGYQAIIRYNMNGQRGRVEVIYGGVGGPDGPLHGHIVIVNNVVESWLEPGAEGEARNRLY